ncbi:MAG: 4-(cytidine 5'-diphospho)-2-C-methyl-D-erythritol kinase [Bacteroidota bacterium]
MRSPPCKINLGLNVLRKRDDGYHDIETCFYPIPWTDILEIIPSSKFEFTTSGNVIPGDGNLCIKAYQLLKPPPAKIHLHKIIPTGAGLGGGSSDAAWTLRLLMMFFSLGLSKDQLRSFAAQIGSDCAFFIEDGPMIGTGRGETLTPANISLKGKFIVIAKPDVHVSTVEAYAGVIPKESKLDLSNISSLKNDFEESVFKKCPAITSIKQQLRDAGAEYASMSGSGSAVYGIFNNAIAVPFPSDYTVFSGWL